jgi:hypothetical protein
MSPSAKQALLRKERPQELQHRLEDSGSEGRGPPDDHLRALEVHGGEPVVTLDGALFWEQPREPQRPSDLEDSKKLDLHELGSSAQQCGKMQPQALERCHFAAQSSAGSRPPPSVGPCGLEACRGLAALALDGGRALKIPEQKPLAHMLTHPAEPTEANLKELCLLAAAQKLRRAGRR